MCVCVALWERERMNDEVDGESTRRRREAEKSCVVVWIGEPERVIDCRDTSSGSSWHWQLLRPKTEEWSRPESKPHCRCRFL